MKTEIFVSLNVSEPFYGSPLQMQVAIYNIFRCHSLEDECLKLRQVERRRLRNHVAQLLGLLVVAGLAFQLHGSTIREGCHDVGEVSRKAQVVGVMHDEAAHTVVHVHATGANLRNEASGGINGLLDGDRHLDAGPVEREGVVVVHTRRVGGEAVIVEHEARSLEGAGSTRRLRVDVQVDRLVNHVSRGRRLDDAGHLERNDVVLTQVEAVLVDLGAKRFVFASAHNAVFIRVHDIAPGACGEVEIAGLAFSLDLVALD